MSSSGAVNSYDNSVVSAQTILVCKIAHRTPQLAPL
jgi:hypothetical protein